jgi:hypothetical protein
MGRTARTAASLSLAALSFASAAAAQTDYDDAMSAAAERERAGRPRDAAASLDALHARYPQDYALALRLGWLWFQAGDQPTARARYQRALSLSDGTSHDARLGLAWTQLRLGETDDARRAFEALAAADPTDASARQGLSLAVAAAPVPLRVWASLWAGAQLYANHPQRSWSLSATASVTAQILDGFVFGATYRAVDYSLSQRAPLPPGVPPPPPQAPQPPLISSTSVQQEVHLVAGFARSEWAARAHLGFLRDASNSMAPATVFGVSGRYSLRGDLSAELSDSVFADHSVVRAVGAWAASLGAHWTLGPVGSLQYGDGTAGGSIGALAGWRGDGYQVALSARYGDERRPTSLVEALFYATDDRVRGTLSLSGVAPLGSGLSLALRYDGLMLTTSAATGSVNASAHFFTAALTGAW